MIGTGAAGTDDRTVRRAHDDVVGGDRARSRLVRPLVLESWQRSLAAGVSADDPTPPTALDGSELDDRREAHPLAPVVPLLVDVVGEAARDSDALLAIADDVGRLLWVYGARTVLRRAERINFAAGALWDEEHAGTNAPGVALRLGTPVAIRSAEHYARPVQSWSCVAVPIHAPGTSRVLGVVDVTGGDGVVDSRCVAMVRAAARMAEAELGRLAALGRGVPEAPLGMLQLRGLGRDQVVVGRPGQEDVLLSPRHSEIVVALAEAPDGLTGEELGVALYPESVNPGAALSTVRAELVRLRGILGADVLSSRPYRLGLVEADWQSLADRVGTGDVAAALRSYRGPLLPHSQAPAVERARLRLEGMVRQAVLGAKDTGLLVDWTRARWGADDLDAWQALRLRLPLGSPLRPIAVAEVERLEAELG